jgi:hypothetical protein
MSSTITALTSGGGLAMAGDTSGQLELKTNNGTTALTVDTGQNVTFAKAAVFSYSASSYYATDGAISNYASTNGVYINGNSAGWLRMSGDGTAATNINIAGSTYSDPNKIKLTTAGVDRVIVAASGDFLVGGTTTIGGNGILLANADYTATYRSTGTAGAYIHAFASDIGGTRTVKYAIYANGTAGAVSDQNLKKNIEPARGYLSDLMNIEVVKYNWISDEENAPKELGYIAQQVETVFPSMVDEQTYDDGDGNSVTQKMLKKEVFIPMMLKAIQELNAKVDAQAATITELQAKVGA